MAMAYSSSDLTEDEPDKLGDDRNYCPNFVPTKVEKYLEFIDIFEDGYTILGASDLNGRYCTGSVWYYNNSLIAPSQCLCESALECETTVCDGKFIGNNNTIVIGEDSGAISIFEIHLDDDQESYFQCRVSRSGHESSVLTISVSADYTSVISAGMDLCVNVWDTNELLPQHTFTCAHTNHVTSAAFRGKQSQVFATCSLDGSARLWDVRQSKPATELIDNPGEGLNALAWQSGDTNTLLLGSSFGSISLLDTRVGKTEKQSTLFNRSVYRMLSIEPSMLAACADCHEVKIIDPLSENLDVRYVDKRHRDFVRGLCYDNMSKALFSCGWDKQVLCHSLDI